MSLPWIRNRGLFSETRYFIEEKILLSPMTKKVTSYIVAAASDAPPFGLNVHNFLICSLLALIQRKGYSDKKTLFPYLSFQ